MLYLLQAAPDGAEIRFALSRVAISAWLMPSAVVSVEVV
jgi:hypothetical protein